MEGLTHKFTFCLLNDSGETTLKTKKHPIMKHVKFLSGLFPVLFAMTLQTNAQETLPEVRIVSLNYKYYKSVSDTSAAQPVRMLERMAASYDLKSADFYEEESDNYFVSFYIPQGQVLAFYDKDGKVIRTVEKYKDVALPKPVRDAVANRYPGWAVLKDIYLVNYYSNTEEARKIYKLVLENGSKRLRVKMDNNGTFKD